MTTSLTQVTGIIDRDPTVKIPFTAYEYELPVIEEIHGETNVKVTSTKLVTNGPLTAADAYGQLQRRFPQHQKEIKSVYRTVAALAKDSGLPYQAGDEQATKYQQAAIVVHAPPPLPAGSSAPAPAPAASDAETVSDSDDGADDTDSDAAGAAARASARAKADAAKK